MSISDEIHRELIDGVSHLIGPVHSQDVHRLMLAHASGEFDKEEQPRNAAGRFGKIAPGKTEETPQPPASWFQVGKVSAQETRP
jgi:hypothetical protein